MKKDTTFKLRLAQADLFMLRGKAAAAGMSAAELIIYLVDQAEIPGYVPTPTEQLPGQLTLEDLDS